MPDSAKQTLTALIQKDKNGYVAECPEVGTAGYGTTIEAALSNLKQATKLYIEEFPVRQYGRPFFTTFDVDIGSHSKST